MPSERNLKLDQILREARPTIVKHWRLCFDVGMTHAPEVTAKIDAAIEDYFNHLKALPEPAPPPTILNEMKRLYEALDEINESQGHGLLETDERELLVPLFVEAAEAAGINSDDFDGEPGGEFRSF